MTNRSGCQDTELASHGRSRCGDRLGFSPTMDMADLLLFLESGGELTQKAPGFMPSEANSMFSVPHCFRSHDEYTVIISSREPCHQQSTLEAPNTNTSVCFQEGFQGCKNPLPS